MADAEMDIIKSDPIDGLTRASKVSLQGGGALLGATGFLLFAMNEADWNVSNALIYLLVVGAIVMGVIAAGLRVIDAYIRYKLADRLLSVKGTSDPKVAADLPPISQESSKLLDRLLDKSILYIRAPEALGDQIDPPGVSSG